MLKSKISNLILSIVLTITGNFTIAQNNIADKIVAVVGENIILKSDIENQYEQYKMQGISDNTAKLKCTIFEEMVIQKLLLHQAQVDSIEITENEINDNLDRRIRYFVNQIGSEEKLEEYYNKSILEIKSEFKEIIKEQMLAERAQATISGDINVTPTEVRKFYKTIHTDSLPMIEANYEIQQLMLKPEVTLAEKEAAKERIDGYKKRIMQGDKFSTLAILYSEDQGSAQKGGELGFVSRDDLVPEFAAVAFNLKSKDEVSRIVESQFGFHIIQLIERKGEKINVRHILITPKVSIEAIIRTSTVIDSISTLIKNDSISFEDAVVKFSQDEDTKQNNGQMINPTTGNTKFEITHMHPTLAYNVNNLKIGEISNAFEQKSQDGKKEYKIIKLVSKTEKHKANIKDDYQFIKDLNVNKKRTDKLNSWIKRVQAITYIKIDESYKKCDFKYINR